MCKIFKEGNYNVALSGSGLEESQRLARKLVIKERHLASLYKVIKTHLGIGLWKKETWQGNIPKKNPL